MKSQAEAEPWEALDLDDSELPSFIRPSKRQFPSSPELAENDREAPLNRSFSNPPILQHCSFRSSQTLTPEVSSASIYSPLEVSGFLIPGPARAVQSAVRRKIQKDPSSFGEQGDPIPTQEYIRMAVEEPGGEDEEFSRDPWLSAVDFIRSEGLVGDDGIAIGTPIRTIKSGSGALDKVNQLVAIVKSCAPNGLGDLMVTLKDPTGTIDASVHKKVLAESDFGRDIRVGAVLILRKVAIFVPSRSSCYLNITMNNISKVIMGEGTLSLQRKTNSATTIKVPTPRVEKEKHLLTQPTAFSLDRGKTEGIMNSLRQNTRGSFETHSGVDIGGENSTKGSNWAKDVIENQNELTGGKSLLERHEINRKTQTAADKTNPTTHQEHWNPLTETQEDAALGIGVTNGEECLVEEVVRPWKKVDGSHQSHSSQQGNTMVDSGKSCVEDATEAKANKTPPPVSGRPVLQWTDEQLDELFAFD